MGTTLLAVSAGDIVAWGTYAAEGTDPTAATLKGHAYALGTLAAIVVVQRVFKGFMATISVLVGLVLGTAVAWILGDATFAGVAEAAPIGLTTPFFFGWPAFSVTATISMVIVMAITAVETTGDVFATGEIVGQRITPAHIANALRADGLSTTLGGVLNSFPYTCFAQNVGLVRLSRVKSRWVVTVAGAIMIGLGLLVTLKPDLAQMVPSWLQILFGSGVTLGATVAIVLNIVFFHIGRPKGEDVALVDGKAIGLDNVNEMDRDTFVGTFGGLYAGATWPVGTTSRHSSTRGPSPSETSTTRKRQNSRRSTPRTGRSSTSRSSCACRTSPTAPSSSPRRGVVSSPRPPARRARR